MKNYESLEKLYYKNKNVVEEFEKRLNNPLNLKTGLEIYPSRRGERVLQEKYQLFYLPIIENSVLQEKIFTNSIKIVTLASQLPQSARDSCLREIMINEIKKSNDIEGVMSTKQELYDRINSKKKDKFSGIVRKYIEILTGTYTTIENIEKIKELYTSLFASEIQTDREYKLDGEFFRKEPVYIFKNGTNEKVHTGNPTESSIIEDLNKLIVFMNKKDIPSLLKSAITHYFLEYIHPFYDGNGRFGRFIFSMYLSRKLDLFTGLSLSYAIDIKKKDYLKSFIDISSPKNFGEITFFVKSILETVTIGQESILSLLEEKKNRLNFALEIIEKFDLEVKLKDVLFLLVQNHIFSKNFPLYDQEMIKYVNKGRTWVNTCLKSLREKGYIIKMKQKPSYHKISEKIVDMIE